MTDEDCAACAFNRPGKNCLRQMQWVWRGETFACDSREYYTVKNQLASEPLLPETEGGPPRSYDQLPYEERQKLLKDRLKLYTQKVGFPRFYSPMPVPTWTWTRMVFQADHVRKCRGTETMFGVDLDCSLGSVMSRWHVAAALWRDGEGNGRSANQAQNSFVRNGRVTVCLQKPQVLAKSLLPACTSR